MATPPLIEVADCVFTNNYASSWGLDYPAYVTGDLVVFNLASDAGSVTHSIPNGPNGETPVIHVDSLALGAGGATISVWHYIATSTEAAGTLTVTPSGSEAFGSAVYVVPDGEFNDTTPIADFDTGGSAGSSSNVPTPAITATAADGTLIAFLGIDTDPVTGTPSGWTDLGTGSHAQVKGHLSGRDAATTASESVPAYNWTITSDSSTTAIYVVNAPAGGGGGGGSICAIVNHLRNQGIS